MNLFLDTETTGFPSDSKMPSDPTQAQICQLGAVLTSANRRVVGEINFLIRPDGWEIPPALTDIHGISQEMCEQYGVPLSFAIGALELLAQNARLLVIHNVPFDTKMLRLAHLRLGGFDSVIPRLPTFCTMQAMTDICALPKARGSGYKWPKLTEAYWHCFQKDLDCAHDAMADVRGCMEVYYWREDMIMGRSAKVQTDEATESSPL